MCAPCEYLRDKGSWTELDRNAYLDLDASVEDLGEGRCERGDGRALVGIGDNGEVISSDHGWSGEVGHECSVAGGLLMYD